MSEQREVGVATWAGQRPRGEVPVLRRRKQAVEVPPQAASRTVDVRDVAALTLTLLGAALVLATVAHYGGLWALLGVIGVVTAGVGIGLGFRPAGGDG